MDSHGVDIFHVAHRYGIVRSVTHYLKLYLLIALDALFDKYLMNRRKLQGIVKHYLKLLGSVGKSAACSSESEGGTKHYGISDICCGLSSLLHGGCYLRLNYRLSKLLAELLEKLSVLSLLYRLKACAQYLHLALLKYSLLCKLNSHVESCLSSESGNYSVRPLFSYYLCHILKSKGLHVYLVRNLCVSHNCRRV